MDASDSPLNRQPSAIPQASIFSRPPAPPPLVGAEKLEGRESLALPMFCRIVGLDFTSRLGGVGDGCTLRLELMPVRDPQLRVHCLFRDVCELRLSRLPAEGLQIAYFAIESVASREWPGIHWQVGEIVSNVPDPVTGSLPQPEISFYAGHAEIASVVMV